MTIAVKPSTDPIERSMLRDTMISTMPVAMMPIDELWTERFQRFRGVMKSPPDAMWKPIQMTPRAITIPSRRVSSSAARSNPRALRPGVGSVTLPC